MKRWIIYGVLGLVVAILVAGLAGFLLLGRFDLGPFAAARASAAFGRTVSIASLHITPGRWVTFHIEGVKVANVPGGTRPEMATLTSLTAEVEAWSLLHGPATIRRLDVDGLSLLLERGTDDAPNWRKKGAAESKDGKEDRSGVPMLHDVHIRNSEVIDRTSSGHDLPIRFDDGVIQSAALDQPLRVDITGAYHDVPITLAADLHSIAELRDAAKPYGANIRMNSGETRLQFDGTLTKPLEIDGADGALTLHAPNFKTLLAVMGAKGDFAASLDLAGKLTRADTLWVLADTTGKLADSPLSASTLSLTDGGRGNPDKVALDLAFGRLDLTPLLADQPGGKGGGTFSVDRKPDPQLNLHLTARQLVFRRNEATGLTLSGASTPGRIDLGELGLTAFGARLQASAHAEAADKGDTLAADATISGLDLQQLRRQLGARDLPMTGRLEGQIVAQSAGETLTAAVQAAHIFAIVSMRGGSISRDIVEKASGDLRRLFRTPKGMTAVSCMLAVIEMRAGDGIVSPLRIRSAEGTVAGQGRFDLNRQTIDLTIGSQSATTSDLALDVPFRISGAFQDPSIRPAGGRPALAVGDLSRLPPALAQAARRNPCVSPR